MPDIIKPLQNIEPSHPVSYWTPERLIARHYTELGGAPGAAISGPEAVGAGNRIRYANGAIYLGPSTNPAWVHGAIGSHYEALGGAAGWLGFPITDETGTPDGRGRYNHFQHGSIYWTATTSPFEVHGAIRDKWASLGWETSFLGYPTTDETDAPVGHGRFNRFEHGSIYWTATAGAFEVHGPTVATSFIKHGDISFSDSTPVGGSADITLNSDGSFVYAGHLHDSGAPDYSDSVMCIVVVPSIATAYTFGHQGQMFGTFTPGSRDDDWNQPGTRAELAQGWLDLCAGHEIQFRTDVDWNLDGWAETIKKLYPVVQFVVSLL